MDKRRIALVCALVSSGSLVGCGASAPSVGQKPSTPGTADSPAAAVVAPGSASKDPDAPKGPGDAPGSSPEEPSPGPATSSGSGFDVAGWLKSRKVKGGPPKDASCEPGQLGNPPVDALSCDEKQGTSVPPVPRKKGEEAVTYAQPRIPLSVYTWYRRIYVVSGGGLKKVFDAPFEVVPSDPVVGEPTQDAYVMMKVEIDSDGTKLEVFEDQMLNCDQVKTKLSELAQEAEMANVAAAARRAADQVCASKGEYVYRNGAFVRKR